MPETESVLSHDDILVVKIGTTNLKYGRAFAASLMSEFRVHEPK